MTAMTDSAPLIWRWDGEALIPASRTWARRADDQLVIGELYRMEAREERSLRSHNHYFACIHDAWLNLPEDMQAEFPNSEALRKYALIKCGYADQRMWTFETTRDALTFAKYVGETDEFSIIEVAGTVVRRWTAQSQSIRAMGKKPFQKSKQDVLDFLDTLLGTERGTLDAEAGKTA